MYLYAELWNPRPAWNDLSPEEQGAYLERVGPSIRELTEGGVDIVGFAVDDGRAPHGSGYRYLAVWTMEDESWCERLEQEVEAAGWHDYFEQVNIRGKLVSPAEALGDMVATDG